MKYQYLVLCWTAPKSGFDLSRKHSIIENLRKDLKEYHKGIKPGIEQYIDFIVNNFLQDNAGLVIKDFTLESDDIVTDPKKQLLPEIHKRDNNAEIIFCINITELVSTLTK